MCKAAKVISAPCNFLSTFFLVRTFSLLECVVHANCADQVENGQKDELLLDELLGDEVTEGDKDENPSGYRRGVKPASAAAFCVSDSRAHV